MYTYHTHTHAQNTHTHTPDSNSRVETGAITLQSHHSTVFHCNTLKYTAIQSKKMDLSFPATYTHTPDSHTTQSRVETGAYLLQWQRAFGVLRTIYTCVCARVVCVCMHTYAQGLRYNHMYRVYAHKMLKTKECTHVNMFLVFYVRMQNCMHMCSKHDHVHHDAVMSSYHDDALPASEYHHKCPPPLPLGCGSRTSVRGRQRCPTNFNTGPLSTPAANSFVANDVWAAYMYFKTGNQLTT